MALIACAECGKEISDKAAACPHCGAPVASTSPKRGTYYNDTPAPAPVTAPPSGSSWWKWLIGVPVGGFMLLMLIGSCSGTPESRAAKSRQSSAIALCWQEQAKKSNDPATARLIAETCEKMAAEASK